MTTGEIHDVPISEIVGNYETRSDPTDWDHVAAMAPFVDQVPPITLNRTSAGYLKVIDGWHRLEAHKREERSTVRAVILQIDEVDAIAMGANLNARHGRLLPVKDRRTQAKRIIERDPTRSNRWIADELVISEHIVAELRPTATKSQLDKVRSRDGRDRPATADVAHAQRQAAEEIAAANPDATVREIAEQSGVSRGTAANVKKDVQEGKTRRHLRDVSATEAERRQVSVGDIAPTQIIQNWAKLPEAKSGNDGRSFCSFMGAKSIKGADKEAVIDVLVAQCPVTLEAEAIAAARLNAALWSRLADGIESRQPRMEVQQ